MVRTIAIAVAVVLMIAGGAIGIMKQLGIGPFSASGGDSQAAASPSEPPRFVDMDPLVIPVFAEDKVITTIQIQLKLETTGAANEEFLNRIKPRISNAFLLELNAFLPRLLRKEGTLDVIAIKQRLQMSGEKVAGPGKINSVLVQSVTDTAPR